ncbi:MAG TPA: DEAD/DEAH box helicase [Thermomicrobiales bacterium]|jgi:superfamily II DNA or RNA helicase
MNPAPWWSEQAATGDESESSAEPRVLGQPASRVLIPGPAAATARSRVTGWGSPPRAQTIRGVDLLPDRARQFPRIDVRVDPATGGSVSLATLYGDFDGVEVPWMHQDRERGSGGLPPGLRWQGDDVPLSRRLTAVLLPSTELLLSALGPMDWPRPLMPYQLVGVRELVARESLLLADDMGLGKTTMSLAAIRILIRQRRITSALVVVPAGLISQWRVEARRWAPELRVSTVHGAQSDRGWQWRTPAHLYLTSYETLRVDFGDNPHAPPARLWDLVVLDEAQRIKNAATEVTRTCKRLRRKRQWAITGTPLENSPDDLISILEFVEPGDSRELRGFMWSAGLRDHLRRVQLRRRKSDVLLDLPPKLVSNLVLPLTPRQRASYERAERRGVRDLQELGEAMRPEHVFNLIGRLRQICNFDPVSGESSKLNDLRERLALLEAEGHKVLVFTQYANAAFGARAIAARLGPSALAYTGDQSQSARDRVLAEFRGNPDRRVLVLSLLAGGQGLNLQEASYVFHFDRWWNPAVVGQAEARSHRLGQRYPVNVYAYTAENTIEERLDRILKDKQLLFDQLVDDVSLDVAASLDESEAAALFGLELRAPKPAPLAQSAESDPTSLDGPELAELVAARLRQGGWEPVSTGSIAAGTRLVLTRRGSESAESLVAYCRPARTPLGTGEVRAAIEVIRAASTEESGALIVCPAGLKPEARTYAADRGIAVWDRVSLRGARDGPSVPPSDTV